MCHDSTSRRYSRVLVYFISITTLSASSSPRHGYTQMEQDIILTPKMESGGCRSIQGWGRKSEKRNLASKTHWDWLHCPVNGQPSHPSVKLRPVYSTESE
ncbi:hypothetical protein B0H11DRAFT_1996513 [Mycena galericulata]|nr:hypothetical protein B0H11DRAFT_1996513 [Mycena galericulata]